MSFDMPALATNTITSLSSVAVLGYTMGYDPLAAIGGGSVAVMIGTIVALCGAYDLGEQFDAWE